MFDELKKEIRTEIKGQTVKELNDPIGKRLDEISENGVENTPYKD